jgi:hypothetical protein
MTADEAMAPAGTAKPLLEVTTMRHANPTGGRFPFKRDRLPAATAADIAALPCVEARRRDDAETDGAILEEATARISETIERVKAGDCGAPFELDIVEALRAVRHVDQAEFMRLRTAIKKANRDVRITALDAAIRGGDADRHTADLLADLARRRCTLFHDPDREPYATFETDGHREVWSIHSRGFIEWLSFQFFKEEGRAPAETAIKSALAALAGQGKFEGEEKTVAVRVARYDGAIWIDLCNDGWQAVEVTPQGWSISNRPPVMFARSSSMRALPMPQAGGDLSALWGIVNIPERERLILLAWMLECLRAETPFAVLELGGEQGSAKTSTQYFLRELIDPNSANNRAAPKNVEDIFVTARNAHLVSFENLSHLPSQYQDALCVLATGGGFATRTFYTNADETVLKVKKPGVLNGIAVVVTAQDLLDRTVHIDLPTLETRVTAEELQRQFDQKKAGIVGGLLDLLVRVLAILPTVEVEPRRLPRMADFSLLGEAVYRAHGKAEGAFLADYAEKRKDGVHRTLEASPVAGAALTYLDHNPMGFDGTVKGMWEALTPFKPEGESWPRSPKGFGDALRQIAPALRLIDINARISDKPGRAGYTCILKRKRDISRERGKVPCDVHDVHQVHAAPGGREHCELGEHGPSVRCVHRRTPTGS